MKAQACRLATIEEGVDMVLKRLAGLEEQDLAREVGRLCERRGLEIRGWVEQEDEGYGSRDEDSNDGIGP